MAVAANLHQVLLVTSDDLIRDCVQAVLVADGARVSAVRSAAEALEWTKSERFHVVLVHHDPPAVDALGVLAETGRHDPDASRIVLFDAADRSRIGEAVRSCDLFACIVSPWDNDILALSVQRAAELASYRRGAVGPPLAQVAVPGSEIDCSVLRSVIRVFV